MSVSPLLVLLARVAFFSVPFYFFWWAWAAHLAIPVVWSAGHTLNYMWPNVIGEIVQSDAKILLFVSDPGAFDLGIKRPSGMHLVINVMAVSYGSPLFIAFALSSPGTSWQHLQRISAGLILLLVYQVIAVFVWASYLLSLHPKLETMGFFASDGIVQILVNFAYHLNLLMLPVLLPLLLWAWFYRETVSYITGRGADA